MEHQADLLCRRLHLHEPDVWQHNSGRSPQQQWDGTGRRCAPRNSRRVVFTPSFRENASYDEDMLSERPDLDPDKASVRDKGPISRWGLGTKPLARQLAAVGRGGPNLHFKQEHRHDRRGDESVASAVAFAMSGAILL
jgi:hypothetical protein